MGAAIGEALLGKKIGRKAMLWGAVANTIPDLDVFLAPLFTDAEQLLVHRGLTHSLLFIALLSPLLGWLFRKCTSSNVSQKEWTILFLSGMLTHTFLDSFTAYGTGWFEPFSSVRVSFNTIFVADPHFTLPLLVCVLVGLIVKNGSPKRAKWAKAGLWISGLYLLFTVINHQYVHHVMEKSFAAQNLKADKFVVTPSPLNNYLWAGYTRDSTGSYYAYYSIFDKSNDIKFTRYQRNDSLLTPYNDLAEVKIFKQFSKGFYIATKEEQGHIFFNDVRFGQLGGWDNSDASFVFAFDLTKGTNNKKAFSRTKFKTSISDALASLINRIKGR
jgi:inner membrane protein